MIYRMTVTRLDLPLYLDQSLICSYNSSSRLIFNKCIAQQCRPWMHEVNQVYPEMTITSVRPSDPGNKENKENKIRMQRNASRCSPTPKSAFLFV
jgi:hypothetical protein